MAFYWPSAFRADHELRNWDTLVETVQTQPHGVFWPLLGARRSGKTWALQAIEYALGKQVAAHVVLEQIGAGKRKLPDSARGKKILLFDEPSCMLFNDGGAPNSANAQKFVEWCRKLKDQGTIITLALTPAEWHAVREFGGGLVSDKDLESARLGPLSNTQAQRVPRTPEQRRLFDQLPPIWLRNPFLLVEIFRHAMDTAAHEWHEIATPDDIRKLTQQTIEELNTGKYDYKHHVLNEGLLPEHREALAKVARREQPNEKHGRMLRRLGLLMTTVSGEYEIGDPVLADHYPQPVRIHHISDLHFGPKTAFRVDAKDASQVGGAMATAAGQGPVRDEYLNWLEQLEPHQRPNLLVVSGDIAEFGQDDQLEDGRAWLERVAAKLAPHPGLGPNDPRVLLVPGNHDVDWATVEGSAGARRRHLPFSRVFAATPWPFPRLVEPPESREPAHQHYRSLGVAFALLGSPELGGTNDPQYARLDPGLVHDRDLQRLRSAVWKHEPIRIAVVHHPLADNPSIATEVAPFSGLKNAPAVQAALQEQGFALLLHGHTHAAYLERKGELLVVGAGTIGSREVYERHGFNEIVVIREGTRYQVDIQIYERKAQSFVTADSQSIERVAE